MIVPANNVKIRIVKGADFFRFTILKSGFT